MVAWSLIVITPRRTGRLSDSEEELAVVVVVDFVVGGAAAADVVDAWRRGKKRASLDRVLRTVEGMDEEEEDEEEYDKAVGKACLPDRFMKDDCII